MQLVNIKLIVHIEANTSQKKKKMLLLLVLFLFAIKYHI